MAQQSALARLKQQLLASGGPVGGSLLPTQAQALAQASATMQGAFPGYRPDWRRLGYDPSWHWMGTTRTHGNMRFYPDVPLDPTQVIDRRVNRGTSIFNSALPQRGFFGLPLGGQSVTRPG